MALAMELRIDDHGQVIFQTNSIREPPHSAGRADEIPELVGAVQRSGIVVDVVMNVLLICMSGNKESVLSLCPAHSGFIADAVCFLRSNLSGLEGLAYLIAQHIDIPALLPARDGLVLGLAQEELRICGHVVALVGRNQFAALRLVRVFAIVKTSLQRLRNAFSLTDFVFLEIGCGRRQPPSCMKNGGWVQPPLCYLGTKCPGVSACDKLVQRKIQTIQPCDNSFGHCLQAIG